MSFPPSPQQQAVTDLALSGQDLNIVVKAYAGCGKTTCIISTARAYLEKFSDRTVFITSFSKAICNELEARLQGVKGASSSTLSSAGNRLCVKFLGKRYFMSRHEKRPPSVVTWERIDSAVTAYRKVFGTAGAGDFLIVNSTKSALVKIVNWIKATDPLFTTWKPFREAAEQFLENLPEGLEEECLEACAQVAYKSVLLLLYEVTEGSGRVEIDFPDQVFLPVRLGGIRPLYDFVIVDEAQDMNKAQLLLARALCKIHMMIVGDPNQAIYGFAGADSGAIDRMTAELSANVLPLSVTYRCPKSVVRLAQEYVPDFTAHDANPEGEVTDPATETLMFEQAEPGDMVLSRRNAPLMEKCLGFLKRGKRSVIAGRAIGKMLLDVATRLEGKEPYANNLDLLTRLEDWKDRETEKVLQFYKSEEAQTKKIDSLNDVWEVFSAMSEYIPTPEGIKAELDSLFLDIKNHKDFIVCQTLHKSKGLEAPNVFILRDGFGGEEEAERCLAYVGVTRTKKRLYMVG